jgi:hypothetical protein
MELRSDLYLGIVFREDKGVYKHEKRRAVQLDRIMKKLFTMQNKRPLIDFFNAIRKQYVSFIST